jgi:phosphopantothenoylcysteine decarboxylase/phosphopantothenate--cysteine ligase
MLKGKKIILGITGSIAAYKAIILVRLLKKAGADVRVVMTPSANSFVSPLVLSTLSQHPVWCEFTSNNIWNNHVELALWGDALLIVPASCNTIAKMSIGQCDNLLLATYLSVRCPVFIAPSMDEDMYKHPASQQNLKKITSLGHFIIPPGTGFLASGLHGEGRMAEPEEIVGFLTETIGRSEELKGKQVLINAGPTREAIDPVRFISNHSSGKMGIALAETAYLLGAEVHLILGPSCISPKYKGIQVTNVESADEMFEAMMAQFQSADWIFCAAAVADYKPANTAVEKIKKSTTEWELTFNRNVDILHTIGQCKTNQVLIGFALETNDEIRHAQQKLQSKNADMIVLNSLQTEGAGFGKDTNQVTLLYSNGQQKISPLALKHEIARFLLDAVSEYTASTS